MKILSGNSSSARKENSRKSWTMEDLDQLLNDKNEELEDIQENFDQAKRQIGCLNEEKKNMLAELNYAEVIIDEQINKIQE